MQITVLGGGESGIGAARLAQKQGLKVFLSDRGKIKDEFKHILNTNNILFEEGQHTEATILASDEVIISPGIPLKVPIIQKIQSRGIPVTGEIEFAFRYVNGQIIAITGSNGKTTTTKLTHHLLQTGGIDCQLGGNIGHSFAGLIADQKTGPFVLELSSFQLDTIKDFRPDISAILNITPDHLDRYNNQMELYTKAKFRITQNQKSTDRFLFNIDNDTILNFLVGKNWNSINYPISSRRILGTSIIWDGITYELGNTALLGRHNAMNALFAICIANIWGIAPAKIQEGLQSFVNVPHRMEIVKNIAGIQYINDSKATNVDAVYYALEAISAPIVWIVGGQDKGNDYSLLNKLVQQKVKNIICLGVDNNSIIRHFQSFGIPIKETNNMKDAVNLAQTLSSEGDTVLLSPACASFDLFKNYIDRGAQFKACVREL